ncbi:hypothetical protein [Nocardia sp. NPDC004750]
MLGRADVDRRSFLRTSVYSAALSATALVAQSDMARLVRVDESTHAGMPEVRAVQGITDAFLRMDEVKGGGIGRTAVAEFLSTDVASLLRSRFADSTVRSAAFSAAAELAYLAGFKAHDAGEDGIAQRYFLSAFRLAEESQMPGQDAWVLRILAMQGTDIGQPNFSPVLAEAAVTRDGGQLGPDATALLTIAVARCHAETGDHGRALAALRTAEPHITPDLTSEQPRWVSMWCPNKGTVVDQAAKTFLALGDLANAERYYELATGIWDRETHARVWALSAAETGLLHWKRGKHTDAVDMWRSALAALHAVNSVRTTTALCKIRRTAPELFEDAAPTGTPAP